MLVVQRMSPSPRAVTATSTAAPVSPADTSKIPPETSTPAGLEQKTRDESAVPGAAATGSFTVRVMPLQNEDTDAGRKERVAAMYAAFLDKLRAVPGLILLGSAPAGNTSEAAPNYRITIRNEGPPSMAQFLVRLQVETLKRDGGCLAAS